MSPILSRRDLLKTASCGFGYLALSGLCNQQAAAAAVKTDPLAPKSPHHPPKAKRVIFLFMRGGPSHVDTFDYKPALARDNAAENKVHIHDLQATMLHLLGMNHEKLTYRYSGRNFRLTNVAGRVVKEIIA